MLKKMLRKHCYPRFTLIIILIFQLILSTNLPCYASYGGDYISDYYTQSYFYSNGAVYKDAYNSPDINITKVPMSLWSFDYFYGTYEMKWIRSPQDPTIRLDLFRLIYDLQMSAKPNESYDKSTKDFQDLISNGTMIRFNNVAKILSGTSDVEGNSILDGVKNQYYQLNCNWDSNLTRAEFAKIICCANSSWWKLPQIREYDNSFNDIESHWANDYIKQAYSLGLINGIEDNKFAPDNYVTNEQVIYIFSKIADLADGYSYVNFIDAVNSSDILKILESYKQYYDFSPKFPTGRIIFMPGVPKFNRMFPIEAYPPTNAIMYKDKTLYLVADINWGATFEYGFSLHGLFANDIVYTTADSMDWYTARISPTGDQIVTACSWGETDITISNKYGSDTLHVVILDSVYKYPKVGE